MCSTHVLHNVCIVSKIWNFCCRKCTLLTAYKLGTTLFFCLGTMETTGSSNRTSYIKRFPLKNSNILSPSLISLKHVPKVWADISGTFFENVFLSWCVGNTNITKGASKNYQHNENSTMMAFAYENYITGGRQATFRLSLTHYRALSGERL